MRSLGLVVACLVTACGGADEPDRDSSDQTAGGAELEGSVSASFRDAPFTPEFGIATFRWPELNPDGFGILLSTAAIDCANIRTESHAGYYVYAAAGPTVGTYPATEVLVMHLDAAGADATKAVGGDPGEVVLTSVTDARVAGTIDWTVQTTDGRSEVQGAFDVVRCP